MYVVDRAIKYVHVTEHQFFFIKAMKDRSLMYTLLDIFIVNKYSIFKE